MFRLAPGRLVHAAAQPPDIFGSASEGHDRRWVGSSVGARSSAGADDRASRPCLVAGEAGLAIRRSVALGFQDCEVAFAPGRFGCEAGSCEPRDLIGDRVW